MTLNLEGKRFRSESNSDNGEVGADTIFDYHQAGEVIWADYHGGEIVRGHLIGRMLTTGQLDFRYHHLNRDGELKVGTCRSKPEVAADGRIGYQETWQWMSGDRSKGNSKIVEVDY